MGMKQRYLFLIVFGHLLSKLFEVGSSCTKRSFGKKEQLRKIVERTILASKPQGYKKDLLHSLMEQGGLGWKPEYISKARKNT